MTLYLLFMSMRFAGVPIYMDTPGVVTLGPCSSETVTVRYDGERLFSDSSTCAYIDGVLLVQVSHP